MRQPSPLWNFILFITFFFLTSNIAYSFLIPPALKHRQTNTNSPNQSRSQLTKVIQTNSNKKTSFDITEEQEDQNCIMFESMSSTYKDLSERIISRLKKDESDKKLINGQLFIGIGGGPGSGKSTTAEAVRDLVNQLLGDEHAAVVLPMDGFHYSRAELQKIASTTSETETIQGKPITYENLLARRGAPWTFDAKACITAFSDARQNGEASLPTYSRTKSDPVPDGVILSPRNRVVLLEGNYLLAFDDDLYGWGNMKEMNIFDETWYVECTSMAEQRERLISRHLETWNEEKSKRFGASGREGAARRADSNDVLNAEWITNVSRKHADLIIVNK